MYYPNAVFVLFALVRVSTASVFPPAQVISEFIKISIVFGFYHSLFNGPNKDTANIIEYSTQAGPHLLTHAS